MAHDYVVCVAAGRGHILPYDRGSRQRRRHCARSARLKPGAAVRAGSCQASGACCGACALGPLEPAGGGPLKERTRLAELEAGTCSAQVPHGMELIRGMVALSPSPDHSLNSAPADGTPARGARLTVAQVVALL